MYDVNVKKFIEPLVLPENHLNKKDINTLENIKNTLKDCIYFKCFEKIFPNHKEYIFMRLLTAFKYKKYKPHDILLNYNDIVNKLYFVILGKINIYKISLSKIKLILESLCKKHKNQDQGKEILEYFNTYTKRYLNALSEKNIFLKKHNTSGLSHNNIIQSFKEIKELETFFRVIINNNKLYDFSLEDGKMFGEEYLFNYIKYSNCIIECETECIIGELDKEDYEKIFRKVNVIERSNVTGFIVNLKIFNSSNFFLPKLQRCLIKRYFAKNEIIFNQNDPFRAFYVIRKGKINLSLKISKKVNCDLEPEIIMGNKKNKRFTSSSAFVVKGEYLESNEYNLVTVEEGEFIGEVEYYKKKTNICILLNVSKIVYYLNLIFIYLSILLKRIKKLIVI
jgi:CRP-like cAMP-binding protein